jgi:hypothetical protein
MTFIGRKYTTCVVLFGLTAQKIAFKESNSFKHPCSSEINSIFYPFCNAGIVFIP